MFSLEKKYHTSNKYSGSDWNYEETTKYVFSFDLGYVEAGYFIHYLESENGIIEKKHVIELPSSYGCPMKCAFCASSLISNVKPLSSNEIYKIFYYIYENNHLTENKSLLVSMKGIGDLYFTIDSVLGAIKQMASVNKKITFSVSSCYWTYDMLKKVENMSTEVLFRSIQFTYVSYDNDVLKNIIKFYESRTYDIDMISSMITKSKLHQFKINYIMIEGVNDSEKDFEIFISKLKKIRQKIVIRISKMNVTESSKMNKLNGTTINKMMDFKKQLKDEGFNVYLFYSYKDDQMNCGQLIMNKKIEETL